MPGTGLGTEELGGNKSAYLFMCPTLTERLLCTRFPGYGHERGTMIPLMRDGFGRQAFRDQIKNQVGVMRIQFLNSFKYLLSACCALGTTVGSGNTELSKTGAEHPPRARCWRAKVGS